LSDHLPITVVCNCDVHDVPNTLAPDNTSEATQTYLRWDHADLTAYYELTRMHLTEQYALLKEVTGLENLSNAAVDLDCIKLHINSIYNKVIDILRNCANLTVPERKKQFYKFWWNEELDCLKQQSIDDHKLWKTLGKPRHGPIFDKHRASKLLYKQRIREFQRSETSSYTNELHDALLEKNGPTFWKCWRSKLESSKPRAGQVDGLVNDNDIVCKFVNYFAEASSNLTVEGSNNLQQIYADCRPNYCGTPHSRQYEFDVELVDRIVHDMKHGKAAGIDGLTVEHLLHSHPVIFNLLSTIFNMFIKHGFVPDDFGRSYTVPLPKGNSVNKAMSVDDFRGISISPVISKVFERCILKRYSGFLETSDSQFGFKKGLGCSHAIYSVKCVVNHYTRCGSTVTLCALDLKKAFDKMNHNGLYIKLMDRHIPNNLLAVLEYWYDLCTTCVRWGNVFSCFFKLKCGVRQGGVLSPYLFACYIDDLVETLQRSGLGCNIKFVPVCIFLYADDIILISPSVDSMQQMLLICQRELAWLDMALNAKKSVCMRFGPRFDKECESLITIDGQQLVWVNTCRYLGIFLVAARYFKCSFDNAKKAYYRSFNAIFGKVGRLASEEVVIKLLQTKCLPIILYGLDACHVNAADKHSFDFMLTRSLMKLFQTGSNPVITECRRVFNIKLLSESITDRKITFLLKFASCCNTICHLFADVATTEHSELITSLTID
jgi:hypothetical protein